MLVWAFSFYAVSTLLSMAAMSIGAALLVVALGVDYCRKSGGFAAILSVFRQELSCKGSFLYGVAAVALTVACLLSLIVAIFYPLNFGDQAVRIRLLADMAKCWYLFWPLVLVVGLRRLTLVQRNTVLRVWLIAFGFLSLIGIFQYFTGWPRPQPIPPDASHFHVTLFLGHHLSVASIFIFPFFAALDQLAFRGQPLLPRWLLIALVGLGGLALVGTYSRILWLAFPIGLLVWAVLSLPKKVMIPAVLVLLLGAGLVSQLPVVQMRMHDSLGVSTRQELWKANLEFFKMRPVTGVGWHHNLELAAHYFESKLGPGNYFVGHAHNTFIEMLASTGSFGVLAWLFWCGVAIWLLLGRQSGPGIFMQGWLCAWLVFHLNGLTQVNFWESKVLHQMAWVVAWSLLWKKSLKSQSIPKEVQ